MSGERIVGVRNLTSIVTMNRSHCLSRVAAWAGLLAGLLTLASGCNKSEPPRFRPNTLEMIRNEVSAGHRQEIAAVLDSLFGTPDEPIVAEDAGLDLEMLKRAAGPVWTDQDGNSHGLYRQHCAHCHGISGDGNGPTAAFLNPYPRDYRAGKFKFKSTDRPRPPTHDDLMRILDHGIPGTAMPSFRLLESDEKDALVEYVKYLSMRGQMEMQLVYWCVDELEEEDSLDEDRDLLVEELLLPIADVWMAADDFVIRPDQESAPRADRALSELATSVAKGRELFYGTRANCFSCHGETGLGDGQTTEYDDWNKAVKELETDHEGTDIAALGLLTPRTAKPRNLRKGVYSGGRRPLDLYWRVYSGINGTPMPAVGPAQVGGEGVLSSEEIWNLVDFIRQLPFEPASMPARRQLALKRERL
jgi:mono/diheme cytochrome c family protein